MKKLLLVIFTLASIAIISCSKDEGAPDKPNTTTLAKSWFVRVQGPSSTSNYSLFSTRTLTIVEVVDTFGTQAARTLADTIILDDHNLINPTFRTNVKIDVASRVFGAGQYKNWNDTANSIIIKEGQMFRNGGKSKTGRTVDSIYIKYAFKSAPSVDYLLRGHERTGFIEDEY